MKEWVDTGKGRKIALVGATNADVRDVMVLGDKDTPGLIDLWPSNKRPVYRPSLRKIRFWNGAVAKTYSAEKPARLRGPNHDKAWADEVAAWEEAGKGRMRRTWDMLKLTLRKGEHPQLVVTTTPKPLKLLRELIADPKTVVTTGTTYENIANLAETFITEILRVYEGTRLGRQELLAELLKDVEGALWRLETIERFRVRACPLDVARTIIGVDPSVKGRDLKEDGSQRDLCGIVASCRAGRLDQFSHYYVLGDLSLNAPPDVWAREVVRAFWYYGADWVAAEANNGGDLVRIAIQAVDPRVPVKLVTATQGKYTRAEVPAMKYERGEVHHVGAHPLLEEEQTTWVPDGTHPSPGRIDGLVWSIIADMEDMGGGAYAA